MRPDTSLENIMNEQGNVEAIPRNNQDEFRITRGRIRRVMRLMGFRVLSIIIGVATGLVFCECILRLGIVNNPLYGQLTPSGKRVHPAAKVLILGDSFIYKGGELDKLLLERVSPYQVELLNLAVGGTGPLDSLEQVRSHARNYHPDIVVFCIFAGNDITDTIFRLSESRFKVTARSVVKRSYLYHLIRSALYRPPVVPRSSHIAPTIVEQARQGQVNPYMVLMPSQRKARQVPDNLLLSSRESQRAGIAVDDAIREVHSICQELGSKLLLVVFPDSNQVNRAQFEFYRRLGFALDDRTLSTAVPQERWKTLANSLSVPMVDMLPQFRALGDETLYRENDIHFNSAGNERAADLITKALGAVLFPPGGLKFGVEG